jgi:hypothetical protein
MLLEPLEYANFEIACSMNPTRMTIRPSGAPFGFTKLIIPDWKEASTIRYLITRGNNLEDAYGNTFPYGFYDIFPTEEYRPCIYEVYKTPISPSLSENQANMETCKGYNRCMQEWVMANLPDPDPSPRRRRMCIGKWQGKNVYAPSPDQGDCIISKFTMSRNMITAFKDCGCSDILPGWPGGIELIASLHKSNPTNSMYRIAKDALNIMAIQYYIPPETTLETFVPSLTTSPPINIIQTETPEKKSSAVPYYLIAIAGAIFLLMKK